MYRVAIPAFLLSALALSGADPTGLRTPHPDAAPLNSDSEVQFVRDSPVVSVRALQISRDAKEKYADGERRLRKDDREGARLCFEAALAIEPEFAAAWNALGVLTADDSQAEQHFRRALQADPENMDAALNLGAHLLKSGRAEAALEFNQRVAFRVPSDGPAQLQYALNLYQLGELADAEIVLLRVKALTANSKTRLATPPQLFLAEIYARRGEKDRAVAELKELLKHKVDPQLEKTLRGAMARLEQGSF